MIISGIVAAIVIVLVVIGIDYAKKTLQSMESSESDTISMPDFVNKNYATEINGNSAYADFTFKIEEGNNPDKEAGIVLRQSPNSGMSVKKGREVTLIVNKGEEEQVVVPDLTNYEQTAAVNELIGMGLKTKIQTIADDNVEDGYVVKTDPQAQSSVAPTATVIVYVSKGKSERQVPVPDVMHSDLDRAKEAIETAGLTVGEVTENDDSDAAVNTVISVSPEINTKVKEGSKVDLVVSSGKGTPKTLSYSVYLPSVDQDVALRVYRNGTLEMQENGLNLAMTGSYNIEFTGKTGTDKVVVKLDEQLYMELDFDYDTQQVTPTGQYQYVPPEPPISTSQPSASQPGTASQ